MDVCKGIVEIDNDLVIKPGYKFQEFKETKYYTNQDGIRIIYLDSPKVKVILGHSWYIDLNKLSLSGNDAQYPKSSI